MRGVYSVIDQLSRTHLSTLERLIFHLVRYVGPGQLWAMDKGRMLGPPSY